MIDANLFVLIILFLSAGVLIHYACITYFHYKLDHFKKISSEISRPIQTGEHDAENE